jgi:hypothetical protein
MMRKVREEKDEFEPGLQRYYAVRSVFSQLTNNLFGHLGLDALRELKPPHARGHARGDLLQAAARGDEAGFFNAHLRQPRRRTDEIGEITKMMEAMYKRFAVEHGLKLAAPTASRLLRYEKEVERLEARLQRQFNTLLSMVTTRSTS